MKFCFKSCNVIRQHACPSHYKNKSTCGSFPRLTFDEFSLIELTYRICIDLDKMNFNAQGKAGKFYNPARKSPSWLQSLSASIMTFTCLEVYWLLSIPSMTTFPFCSRHRTTFILLLRRTMWPENIKWGNFIYLVYYRKCIKCHPTIYSWPAALEGCSETKSEAIWSFSNGYFVFYIHIHSACEPVLGLCTLKYFMFWTRSKSTLKLSLIHFSSYGHYGEISPQSS